MDIAGVMMNSGDADYLSKGMSGQYYDYIKMLNFV